MNTRIGVLLSVATCLALSASLAGAEPFIQIENPQPFGLETVGFELPRNATVEIDAVGLRPRYSDDLSVYAWVIDSQTRKPVWVMKERDTDRQGRSRVLRHAETSIDLQAGRYELYFFTGTESPNFHFDWQGLSSLGVWLDKMHWDDDDDDWDDRDRSRRDDDDWDDDDWDDRDRNRRDDERDEEREERYREREEHYGEREEHYRERYEYDRDDDWDDDDERTSRKRKQVRVYSTDDHRNEWIEDYIEDCYVKLTATGLAPTEVRRFDVTGGHDGALVRHNRLGDSEFIRTGFRLSRPTNLHVNTVFEYPRGSDGPADFGWIIDADTREKVWYPRKRDTRKAGGARKNRMIDGQINLEAGNYILYYGTDDSHSYEEWNANPPYDPVNWGITVLPGDSFDRAAFSTYEPPARDKPLLAHTRAEDYDLFEQPFKLTAGGKLLVHALGEYDESDDEFVDHGWIADARTGEPIWEMTRRNTMPAGGASKNRMFDGVVELEAGEYIAFYVTDDSHSYEDWNSATPFSPKSWGISIYPGPGLSPTAFRKLAPGEVTQDPDILVQMVRVGDRERRRERFTLDAPTRVHIYAVGEGMGGRMYDYGYIVDDDSGRIVWEMDYRDTRRAGGAKKNRMIDEMIRLPAGSYKAVYRTDGSHSFEDWNAGQPRDPWNWGMTIRRAD